MEILPYEKGVRQVSMKRTILLCILFFALPFISLFGVQIFNDQVVARSYVRESREFHNLLKKISEGIAFCYSGDSKTTGFAVSPDGWYITAGHGVDKDFPQSQKISVKLERKRDAKVYEAERIISPPLNTDLLLFKIDYSPKYYFKTFSKPHLFEENWIIGFRGESGKVASPAGYATHDVKFPFFVRTTARAMYGQSGGPVINRKGQVLGVAVLINTVSLDCLFVPSQVVEKYIEENIKK